MTSLVSIACRLHGRPWPDRRGDRPPPLRLAQDLAHCRELGLQARQVALTLDWDGIITQFEALLRTTIASHNLHALPAPQ